MNMACPGGVHQNSHALRRAESRVLKSLALFSFADTYLGLFWTVWHCSDCEVWSKERSIPHARFISLTSGIGRRVSDSTCVLCSSAAVKRDDRNLVRFASWDQTSQLSQTVIHGSVEYSKLHTTLSRLAKPSCRFDLVVPATQDGCLAS